MVGNTISGLPQPVVVVSAGASASFTPSVLAPQGAIASARFQQLAVFGSSSIATLTKQVRNLSPDTVTITQSPSAAAQLIPKSSAPITAQFLAQETNAPEVFNQATAVSVNADDGAVDYNPHTTLGTLATLSNLQKNDITSGKVTIKVQSQLLPQSSIVRDTKGSVYAGSAALAYSYAGIRLLPKAALFSEQDEQIKA